MTDKPNLPPLLVAVLNARGIERCVEVPDPGAEVCRQLSEGGLIAVPYKYRLPEGVVPEAAVQAVTRP